MSSGNIVEVVPDGSLIIQLLNFLVTMVGLNLLLFKPIREIIRKRKEFMGERLTDIEKFTTQADTKVADYEAALAKARKEATEIRSQFKDEGSVKETELLSAAGQDAASTLKSARAEIDAQAGAALGELKKSVDSFAQKATDKILGQA